MGKLGINNTGWGNPPCVKKKAGHQQQLIKQMNVRKFYTSHQMNWTFDARFLFPGGIALKICITNNAISYEEQKGRPKSLQQSWNPLTVRIPLPGVPYFRCQSKKPSAKLVLEAMTKLHAFQ